MRLVSWNVNGIRAVARAGLVDFLQERQPDVLCLQETKALPSQVEFPSSKYEHFWNPAEKPGYAGTAMFTRIKPVSVTYGMGIYEHDREGRLMTMEFPDFSVVNCYTPNSKRGLVRLPYRLNEWDVAFLAFLKKLQKKKPVILCGDLNVAHKEIDIARPKQNLKTAGFTPEERANFDKVLAAGFVDTFRLFNNEPGQYSWWSYLNNARKRNIGWRLDYFCVSKVLVPRVKKAEIWQDVKGSDHCPVFLEIV